jgi:hypothetical protein
VGLAALIALPAREATATVSTHETTQGVGIMRNARALARRLLSLLFTKFNRDRAYGNPPAMLA